MLIAYQRIDPYICLTTNMRKIYLSLGSNQGSRLENLQTACIELSNYALKINASSPIYETAPWGKSDQPWFYNLVLDIDSTYGA